MALSLRKERPTGRLFPWSGTGANYDFLSDVIAGGFVGILTSGMPTSIWKAHEHFDGRCVYANGGKMVGFLQIYLASANPGPIARALCANW
jgi:hypothetical protein